MGRRRADLAQPSRGVVGGRGGIVSALKMCERCGKQQAIGTTPSFRNGRFGVSSLCSDCMTAQARGNLPWVGGAAIAALALGVGAALVGEQMQRARNDETAPPAPGPVPAAPPP